MKKSFVLITTFCCLFFMISCSQNATQKSNLSTANKIEELENELFEEDGSLNLVAAQSIIEAYRQYAKENQNDSLSPEYLFKALEISIQAENPSQSLSIISTLEQKYPTFEKTSIALFLRGFVLENLNDQKGAKVAYQEFIDKYPNHNFVDDAQSAINNLGKTPEELIKEFEATNP